MTSCSRTSFVAWLIQHLLKTFTQDFSWEFLTPMWKIKFWSAEYIFCVRCQNDHGNASSKNLLVSLSHFLTVLFFKAASVLPSSKSHGCCFLFKWISSNAFSKVKQRDNYTLKEQMWFALFAISKLEMTLDEIISSLKYLTLICKLMFIL